jgi:hypothetical protein
MKKLFCFLLLATLSGAIHAEGKSWIKETFPIPSDNEIDEAQQWALCAATLSIYAEIVRTELKKPNVADKLNGLSAGASTAIMGVFAMSLAKKIKGQTEEQTKATFQNTMKYAAMASSEFPKVKRTEILADKELRSDLNSWYRDLNASTAACLKPLVLELQQNYIDLVREIALSAK